MFDNRIGLRIRIARKKAGLSLEMLADKVGVSLQQIHRYETGINKISAWNLEKIAKATGVDHSFFIEGTTRSGMVLDDVTSAFVSDRAAQDIMVAFNMLDDRRVKNAIRDLVVSISETINRG